MLEDYFLLVRRIPGLSLSITDFWEMDSWTFAKLLELEHKVMKAEEDAYKGKKEYVEQPEGNSPEMNDLVNKYSVVV